MTTLATEDSAANFGEFSLNIEIISDDSPLAKIPCDTSDNCGGSTCASACNSGTSWN